MRGEGKKEIKKRSGQDFLIQEEEEEEMAGREFLSMQITLLGVRIEGNFDFFQVRCSWRKKEQKEYIHIYFGKRYI